VDDSLHLWPWTPEDQGEAWVDHRLKAWFQQMLAEPVPARFLDLIERLDAASGM
jgi:hypothetical protein